MALEVKLAAALLVVRLIVAIVLEVGLIEVVVLGPILIGTTGLEVGLVRVTRFNRGYLVRYLSITIGYRPRPYNII